MSKETQKDDLETRLKRIRDSADRPRFTICLDENCNSRKPYVLEVTDLSGKTTKRAYESLYLVGKFLLRETSKRSDCRLNIGYKGLDYKEIGEIYRFLHQEFDFAFKAFQSSKR